MSKILVRKNLLTMVKNSLGTNMFRNFFMDIDGQEKDILENGGLSCGKYLSTILHSFNLVSEEHATTPGVERDMLKNGWQEITNRLTDDLAGIPEGTVLWWEALPSPTDGTMHEHAGFYIGNHRAIHNDSRGTKVPAESDATFDGTRKIIKVYWHPKLDD